MKKSQKETSIENSGRAALLGLLKSEQHGSGYLSAESLTRLARSLNLPLGEVYGVATFYSFLSTKPQGSNVIRICKSLPCFLDDSGTVIECIEEELGIKPGETTDDRRFSFKLTNCIGACDRAPAMMINSDVYGDLTPEKISRILGGYH